MHVDYRQYLGTTGATDMTASIISPLNAIIKSILQYWGLGAQTSRLPGSYIRFTNGRIKRIKGL